MKSRGTARFWAAYRELPAGIQDRARKAYDIFRTDPGHPSLQFKKIHDTEPIYSVRITRVRIRAERDSTASASIEDANQLPIPSLDGAYLPLCNMICRARIRGAIFDNYEGQAADLVNPRAAPFMRSGGKRGSPFPQQFR